MPTILKFPKNLIDWDLPNPILAKIWGVTSETVAVHRSRFGHKSKWGHRSGPWGKKYKIGSIRFQQAIKNQQKAQATFKETVKLEEDIKQLHPIED